MSGWRGTRSRAIAVLAFAILGAACGGGRDFARTGTGAVRVPGANATLAPVTTTTRVAVRDLALQTRLRAAVTRTVAGRTAQTSISVTVTALGDGTFGRGTLDVAGTGVVDFRSGDAALVLSVPRFDRITGGGMVVQHTVRGVSYLELPAALIRAGGLPSSVRWLRLDPHPSFGADASAFVQAQVDPVRQVASLRAVSDDVREMGTEAVRGVPTTHYAATLDRPAGRAVDVWLDEAGRVRRVVVAVPLPQAAGAGVDPPGTGAMIKVQADLYTFGVPVSVAVPPQAQVRPYASLHLPVVSG
jgi:hypothetical protein